MPKFQGGDAIDTAHCIALKHEILRCEEAFKDFEALARQSIMVGENRALAFKIYNSYARFVHHLYEFMAACFVRDQHDTAAGSGKDATRFIEGYIRHHAQRILTGRREAILNGTAPAWENALSAYPENVPRDFASDFRLCRNKAAGHVKHERATLSLSDFYDRYHMYLYMLYRDALAFWGSLRGRISRPESDNRLHRDDSAATAASRLGFRLWLLLVIVVVHMAGIGLPLRYWNLQVTQLKCCENDEKCQNARFLLQFTCRICSSAPRRKSARGNC